MEERRQSGFILVAALWMIAALAALASAYAAFAVNTAASVQIPQDRLRAEAAIRGGVELAVYRLLSWPQAQRPAKGSFSARIDDFRVEVAYRAETARVDLNAATPQALAQLFQVLGAAPDRAAFLAARVAAWRSALSDADKRREAEIYRKAGLAYLPPGKPFDDVLELALLPGASPAWVAAAAAYVTVFNGTAKVNPLIAEGPVLAVLPAGAAKLVRSMGENVKLDALPEPIRNAVSLDPGEVFRVSVSVVAPRGASNAEIVISLAGGAEEPYQIYSWSDDADGFQAAASR